MSRIQQKHKEVLKKMSENIGMSREQAQLEVGHSETYARSGHIVETDSWKELLEEQLPDSLLLKKHKELLNKKRDTQAVKAGLDMGYKLKGRYAPDKHINLNLTAKPIYGGLSRHDIDKENISAEEKD